MVSSSEKKKLKVIQNGFRTSVLDEMETPEMVAEVVVVVFVVVVVEVVVVVVAATIVPANAGYRGVVDKWPVLSLILKYGV